MTFIHTLNIGLKITIILQSSVFSGNVKVHLTIPNLVVTNSIVLCSWLILKISLKIEYIIVVNLRLDIRQSWYKCK
jgi:hypothetical protein